MNTNKKTAEERAYERFDINSRFVNHQVLSYSMGYAEAIRELVEPLEAENEQLRTDLSEQCRLLGMSGERELAIRAELDRIKRQRYELLEALKEARSFVNGHSEPWYISGQELLSQIDAAITNATKL